MGTCHQCAALAAGGDAVIVLALDPGLQTTGLVVLRDGLPVYRESISTRPQRGLTKREQAEAREVRVRQIAEQVGHAINCHKPAIVGIEEPYHQSWARGAEANRKAADTRTLWQLVAAFREAAGRAGCEVVMVAPAEGFRALTGSTSGDKKRHVWFANQRLRQAGMGELKDSEDHVADALGVGLAAEQRAKMERLTGRKSA